MVQMVPSDDRKDQLDHDQMPSRARDPEDVGRIHGKGVEGEEGGRLGAHGGVLSGNQRSGDIHQRNLHEDNCEVEDCNLWWLTNAQGPGERRSQSQRSWDLLLIVDDSFLIYLGQTGDGRTCVYTRGRESDAPSSRNCSRSCSGGWRGPQWGPPLPPQTPPAPPAPLSRSSTPASPSK